MLLFRDLILIKQAFTVWIIQVYFSMIVQLLVFESRERTQHLGYITMTSLHSLFERETIELILQVKVNLTVL